MITELSLRVFGIPEKMAAATVRFAMLSQGVEAATTAHHFPHSRLGHVADGNFHCQIITDPNEPEEFEEVRHVVHVLTLKIIELGRTCTGEHGIGAGKIAALEIEAEESLKVMRDIKMAMDPHLILNLGKIFTLASKLA